MNIDQIVKKFKDKPYMLDMGKGKLSKMFKCSTGDIIEARRIVRSGIKEKIENEAKILIFDLEVSQILARVWDVRKQYIQPENIVRDRTIMTYAAKWLNEDTIFSGTAYGEEDYDDFELCNELWQLVDEAHVIVAHNVDNYDKRILNARFLAQGFPKPSPYKTVDTLKIARSNFKTAYHRLDFLAKFIGQDGKKENTPNLWNRCMDGEKDAWDEMLEYNIQDVTELEKLYLHIRSWHDRHPSVGVYKDDPSMCCTKCGSKQLTYEKDVYTNTRVFKLYKCKECGSFSRSRTSQGKLTALMTQ